MKQAMRSGDGCWKEFLDYYVLIFSRAKTANIRMSQLGKHRDPLAEVFIAGSFISDKYFDLSQAQRMAICLVSSEIFCFEVRKN